MYLSVGMIYKPTGVNSYLDAVATPVLSGITNRYKLRLNNHTLIITDRWSHNTITGSGVVTLSLLIPSSVRHIDY